ncbi:unnamed protein product [Ilex paraguariensis]|uniref:Uncharacterized protein n=1 Tax=Ilex paraguariensis TaxID=185542 RepID=A0ABC8QU91_9AQUA
MEVDSKPTEYIAIPGGFLTPASSLVSPISTLNFAENMSMIPSIGFIVNSTITINNFVENSGSIEGGGIIKGDFRCPEKSNFEELHDRMDNSSVHFADSMGFQSFREGFTDMQLVDNGEGHSSSNPDL